MSHDPLFTLEPMSKVQMQAWIKHKEDQLEIVKHKYVKTLERKREERMQSFSDGSIDTPIHEVFQAEGEFDAELGGRLLNDYEVGFLKDLHEHAGSQLVFSHLKLSLELPTGPIKTYEKDYLEQFLIFRVKGLVTLISFEKAKFVYVLSERGRSAYQVASLLSEKEVEEWQAWRDMPSLYQLNDKI